MPTAWRLAHNLDESMLRASVRRAAANGSADAIALPGTSDGDLILVSGLVVARELGGRYLVRYVTMAQGRREVGGRAVPTYVTPTPFSRADLVTCLALPTPTGRPRDAYLLIDPSRVDRIGGPRYVQFGSGIEYLLPDGFGQDAIVEVGATAGTRWPLVIS